MLEINEESSTKECHLGSDLDIKIKYPDLISGRFRMPSNMAKTVITQSGKMSVFSTDSVLQKVTGDSYFIPDTSVSTINLQEENKMRKFKVLEKAEIEARTKTEIPFTFGWIKGLVGVERTYWKPNAELCFDIAKPNRAESLILESEKTNFFYNSMAKCMSDMMKSINQASIANITSAQKTIIANLAAELASSTSLVPELSNESMPELAKPEQKYVSQIKSKKHMEVQKSRIPRKAPLNFDINSKEPSISHRPADGIASPKDIKKHGIQLFGRQTKVFNFHKFKEWKLYGEGNIQIWKVDEPKSFYVLLWDKLSRKLLLHMRLNSRWTIDYMKNSTKSCHFTNYNFANSFDGILQRFACHFHESSTAAQFVMIVGKGPAKSAIE